MIESTTNVGINHPNEIWFPVKKNCTATNTANNNDNMLFSLSLFNDYKDLQCRRVISLL